MKTGLAMMVGGALLVGVTGGALASAAADAADASSDRTVTITSMSYGRIPSGLKVGDTIVWTNRDTVPHTVTARDKSFDLRLNPGQTVRQTLGKAGSFAFYCIYHATMRGTLTVAAQ